MIRLALILSALLWALFFGLVSLAKAEEQYAEPPLEWIWGWKIEDVPGMVTIYYDMNQDGEPDFVTAHYQVSMGYVEECPPPTRVGSNVLLGHDCVEGGDPMVYVVDREIRAIRWASDRWLWAIGRTWE